MRYLARTVSPYISSLRDIYPSHPTPQPPLAADYGVKADQLTAKGYGDSKPSADNKTAEGRANNRRVELVKSCRLIEPGSPAQGPAWLVSSPMSHDLLAK